MKRKLFCEISPLTYEISMFKCRTLRRIKDLFSAQRYALSKSGEKLPCLVACHSSLIRRVLGDVDMTLQENKAVNLSLAAPKVSGVVINPGETFSFWKLVGNPKASGGFKQGLIISNSKTDAGVGGGMCQFTNLIHWMVLHSPLEIVEHHHHDGFDLFPDFDRRIPFGTGTSIAYNYLDYRVKNTTDKPFQLIVYVTDNHLCGELRSTAEPEVEYDISAEGEHFVREGTEVYRKGSVYRTCRRKSDKKVLWRRLIRENHAKVMYDTENLELCDICSDMVLTLCEKDVIL